MNGFFGNDDDGQYPAPTTGGLLSGVFGVGSGGLYSRGLSSQSVGNSWSPANAGLAVSPPPHVSRNWGEALPQGGPNPSDGFWFHVETVPNRKAIPQGSPLHALSDNEVWGIQNDLAVPYWRNLKTQHVVSDNPSEPRDTRRMASGGYEPMPGIVGATNRYLLDALNPDGTQKPAQGSIGFTSGQGTDETSGNSWQSGNTHVPQSGFMPTQFAQQVGTQTPSYPGQKERDPCMERYEDAMAKYRTARLVYYTNPLLIVFEEAPIEPKLEDYCGKRRR